MIKTLWIALTTLALANLLAIGGFMVWLRAGDRLDMDRLQRVRMIFAQTRAMEAQKKTEDEQRAKEEADAAARAVNAQLPPLTAAEKIAIQGEDSAVAALRLGRLQREIDDLRRSLIRERQELDDKRAALEKDIAAFEAMRKRIADLEGSEQFKKAVELYQSLPPAKAQALLQVLVEQGETDQVVAYLNAMESRAARKILEKIPDAKLAADLLERLRTRGIEARAPGKP